MARITPLLAEGRVILLAVLPVVWLGVTLLPDVHPSLRFLTWVALAGVVGLGGELSVRQIAAEGAWRRGWGTFWFVPAGATLLSIVWFSVFPDRPRSLVPVAVLVVLGTMLVQRFEATGPVSLRAGAHAVSIGLAFAVAFVIYTVSAHAGTQWAFAAIAGTTLLATLIALRDVRASRGLALGLAATTAAVVTELGYVLAVRPTVPWAFAALLVLALYAGSGASHAALERASRRVFIEVALVTAAGLLALVIGATRV